MCLRLDLDRANILRTIQCLFQWLSLNFKSEIRYTQILSKYQFVAAKICNESLLIIIKEVFCSVQVFFIFWGIKFGSNRNFDDELIFELKWNSSGIFIVKIDLISEATFNLLYALCNRIQWITISLLDISAKKYFSV